jgi:4-carboxymuconolactone decarboxylase
MLNAPEMLARGEHLRAYLRGDSVNLSAQIRELAMLVTARENDCQYIWHAHAAAARRAGLSDDLVNNLRDKRPLTGMSAEETAVVEFGREYFRTRRVSQPTFDAASTAFGVRGLAELTSLMGYYALLAFNINAFEMLPEPGDEVPLPV